MSNVFKFERKEAVWDRKYGIMNMVELMEQMVEYNDARDLAGELTPALITQGIVLFSYIETRCNTSELRTLASSYRKHLEHERLNQAAKDRARS